MRRWTLAAVEADSFQRDNPFFADDPVVLTESELAFAKLDVPLDAIEQFLERLHAAPFMMRH